MRHAWQKGEVFVFGSNLAGIHGAGAAHTAYAEHGAKWFEGLGLHGRSYALPTKKAPHRGMSAAMVKDYVFQFLTFAKANPGLCFFVTRVGCGLAGFKDWQIAPMFKQLPVDNCRFPPEWREYGVGADNL